MIWLLVFVTCIRKTVAKKLLSGIVHGMTPSGQRSKAIVFLSEAHLPRVLYMAIKRRYHIFPRNIKNCVYMQNASASYCRMKILKPTSPLQVHRCIEYRVKIYYARH